MIESLNYLKNNSQFSTDEIMPILEKEISKMMGKEYKIDFFITNKGDSTTLLDVHYLAFPKQETYMKAAFVYNESLYLYSKDDNKHENIKRVPVKNYDSEKVRNLPTKFLAQFGNNVSEDEVFLIGKEDIKIKEAMEYLLLPHKPKYHLFNNFFCYEEKFDNLDETIVEFAKQKVPTKR